MANKTRPFALVAVDVQRDFCAQDGALMRFLSNSQRASTTENVQRNIEAATDSIARLIEGCRDRAACTVFVRSFFDEKYKLPVVSRQHKLRGLNIVMCPEGAQGSDFYRITPNGSDLVVTKHTTDAFLYTPLEAFLRKHCVEEIVLFGFLAELCIMDSGRSALCRGFDVCLAADATAGLNDLCVKSSIADMKALGAEISTVDRVLAKRVRRNAMDQLPLQVRNPVGTPRCREAGSERPLS